MTWERTRHRAGRLVAVLVVVTLVTSWTAALVARADGEANDFVPFWVQTYLPTHVWSGVDQAADFGAVAPFSYFRVVTPQIGPRLHVYNPATRNYAYLDAAAAGPSGPYLQELLLRRMGGKYAKIEIELALTGEAADYGLMGRKVLADGSGMLFVLPAGVAYAFWMHKTLIPLSIAFIDQGGLILDIQDMQPMTDDLHAPGVAYKFALEANQGWFARNRIARGDSMVIPSRL